MPTELVVLSNTPIRPEQLAQTVGDALPGGSVVSYRDGEIALLLGSDGEPVLTLFESVPVYVAVEATAQLREPPASFALWTEITIPFSATSASRALVEDLASAVGGIVKEKL